MGMILLSPVLVAYKLKLVPNDRAKQMLLSYFFKGMREAEFKNIAKSFSLKHIDSMLRPGALDQIRWHQSHGHRVIIVSASLECWLKPWCDRNGLDLIATRMDFVGGLVTGRLLTKNCHGKEKVSRIRKAVDLGECREIYAYGDSRGDKEMLAIASKAYYRPFCRLPVWRDG